MTGKIWAPPSPALPADSRVLTLLVKGAGFRVSGLGCGVWGVGCGVWGVGFGVCGLGFMV